MYQQHGRREANHNSTKNNDTCNIGLKKTFFTIQVGPRLEEPVTFTTTLEYQSPLSLRSFSHLPNSFEKSSCERPPNCIFFMEQSPESVGALTNSEAANPTYSSTCFLPFYKVDDFIVHRDPTSLLADELTSLPWDNNGDACDGFDDNSIMNNDVTNVFSPLCLSMFSPITKRALSKWRGINGDETKNQSVANAFFPSSLPWRAPH